MAGSGSVICNQLGTFVAVVAIVLSIAHRLTPVQAAPAALSAPNQLLWDELLVNGNEDPTYYGGQLRKYHQQQQQADYLGKWPGLRELVLTSDYESNELASNEQLNARLLERLRQLANSIGAADLIEPVERDGNDDTGFVALSVPSKKMAGAKMTGTVKDHSIKKNVQYMSPCHFKICNMGRKRNAGSNTQY